jgi:hypothetical protein
VSAANYEKQFVPEETYNYLFWMGLEVIRKNMPIEMAESGFTDIHLVKGYTANPTLRWFTRPHSTEYTTFNFSGYLEQTFLNDPLRTEKIPGNWCFTVRWKHSRKKISGQSLGVIEFCEVMPDIYFVKHDATLERNDFQITDRLPDPKKSVVYYAKGRFNFDVMRNNINRFR